MKNEPLSVVPLPTPNPNSMKFQVNRPLVDKTLNFENSKDAQRSPLASKLFGFPWTAGVSIGPEFITVTKQDWVEWEMLAEPLAVLLREHLESNEPLIIESMKEDLNSSNSILESDTDQVKLIKNLIESEIRPAVAMDGGDIIFEKYENRKVYLHMKGSCSGCPSSLITLKEGIETRMKELLPEIEEVISV